MPFPNLKYLRIANEALEATLKSDLILDVYGNQLFFNNSEWLVAITGIMVFVFGFVSLTNLPVSLFLGYWWLALGMAILSLTVGSLMIVLSKLMLNKRAMHRTVNPLLTKLTTSISVLLGGSGFAGLCILNERNQSDNLAPTIVCLLILWTAGILFMANWKLQKHCTHGECRCATKD